MSDSRRARTFRRLAGGVLLASIVGLAIARAGAQQQGSAGANVNVISGTGADGDWTLQRQNEPTMACSSRNPQNCLAGANDYRTVDIPFPTIGEKITGDAWLGWYTTKNAGQTWRTRLLPGYPQDVSPAGIVSPLKGYPAGADPIIRPGTNGLFYYGGLVFNRDEGGGSAIFVARFIDNNNQEGTAGEPIAYLGASIVHRLGAAPTVVAARRPGRGEPRATRVAGRTERKPAARSSQVRAGIEQAGETEQMVDKPWMAVDIPRAGATTCSIGGTGTGVPLQTFPGGNVYMAYALFDGPGEERGRIMFSRSTNCGATWSAPRVLSRVPSADVNDDGVANTADVTRLQASLGRSCGHVSFDPNADTNNDCIVNSLDLNFVARGVGLPVPKQPRLSQGATLAIDPQTGTLQVAWRQFNDGVMADAIVTVRSSNGGAAFGPPRVVATLGSFDQGTSGTSFRTNAFPTMAFDGAGRAYLAWSARGFATQRPDPAFGDARIVLSTSTNGTAWSMPTAVDNAAEPGHQIMPALAFAQGKLQLVYYDLREDVSQLFGQYVDELPILSGTHLPRVRHTIDVRAAQGDPGPSPSFAAFRLSQYRAGGVQGSQSIQQLEFNPPNLPIFRAGTSPFMGDYLDVATEAPFVRNGSTWSFNTAATASPVFHGIWTDNRDIRPPANGRWTDYTPPNPPFTRPTMSAFDPTQPIPACVPGQAGMRNQNIYTARITRGLVVGSLGNSRRLGSIQRSFPVFAQNNATTIKSYRLTIANQPVGGQASFKQFEPLVTLDVRVPPRSTVARTVFARSSDPHAPINVNIVEISAPGGAPVAGGQQGTIALNPDPTNPDLENPDLENPDLENPDLENSEVHNPDLENATTRNPDLENPDLENPDLENPDLENTRVANPSIINPDLENPDLENPDLENPDLENPDLENPDLENGALSDTTWTVTNKGNTASAYTVRLALNRQLPEGFKSQLIAHKIYQTPAALGCSLLKQSQTVLLANIPTARFVNPAELANPDLENPDLENLTIAIAPGETVRITLRVYDPVKADAITFRAAESVTPVAVAQAVNTPEADAGITQPVAAGVLTSSAPVPGGTSGGNYNTTLSSILPGTWTIAGGTVPPGLAVNPNTGAVTGTPTTPGTYTFTARFQSTAGIIDYQTVTITVGAVGAAANVGVTAAAPVTPVAIGTPFAFTLNVSNIGPASATNVRVTDTLPEGTQFVSATTTAGSCQHANGTLVCNLGTLAGAGSATIVLNVRPTIGGTHTNSAVVTADQADPVATNNTALSTASTSASEVTPCTTVCFSGPTSYFAGPADPEFGGEKGDFNGDGFVDLIFGPAGVNTVGIMLANGAGGFGPPSLIPIPGTPNGAAVADYNNDGHQDVVISSERTAEAWVLLGNGLGQFAAPTIVALPTEPQNVVAADFNRDGNVDLALAGDTGPLVMILHGNGNGTFQPTTTIGTTTTFSTVVTDDVNNDTNPDLVVHQEEVGLVIILGNGAAGFQPPTTIPITDISGIIKTGDLTGDGFTDLILGSVPPTGAELHVYVGDGLGGFTQSVMIGDPALTDGAPAVGDLDSDGDLDVVWGRSGGGVGIQLNNGSGTFAAPIYLSSPPVGQILVADFNGDGRPDLALPIGDAPQSQFLVFLNTCDQPPAELAVTLTGPTDPVAEGSPFTYNIEVTNNGPNPATGVQLDFAFDPRAEFVAIGGSPASCSVIGNRVTCQLGTLAIGTVSAFAIDVLPRSGGTLQATAGVTGTTSDPDPANNAAFASTTVTPGASTLVVTNTNRSGRGSLYQAIVDANDPGPRDTITFNIPGPGPHTIAPTGDLPDITQSVVIDGTTQPGYAGTPRVEINGQNAGTAFGLVVNGSNSIVRGLAINRFHHVGIVLSGAGGHRLEANFIGTNTSGTAALGNLEQGVFISSPNNVIGGATPAERNVISGNTAQGVIIVGAAAAGNVVSGNYIGSDVSGTARIPNGGAGVAVINGASNNTIGGTAAGAGNLISGNTGPGVNINTAGTTRNTVAGNFIGTNAAGSAALFNGNSGVVLNTGTTNNTVGGTTAAARNVISGNNVSGVNIAGTGTTANTVAGNYVGTNAAGTVAVGNGGDGIFVRSAGNTIGGTTPGAGNLISGNLNDGIDLGAGATTTLIQGNRIGTNDAVTGAIPNTFQGIFIAGGATNNTVGGTTAAARNIVSGNGVAGVHISGVGTIGNTVAGNFIGTNATATAALANSNNGVAITNGASNNTVGGSSAAARNILSGNAGSGVRIQDAATTGNLVRGNFVGTNAAGTAAVPNGINGVEFGFGTAGNTAGGPQPADGNLISGNTSVGLAFFTLGAGGNEALSNLIGTDATGTQPLGNGSHGVYMQSNDNRVGSLTTTTGNVIAFNGGYGVRVETGTGNAVVNNSIFSNGLMGIDLVPGGLTPNDPGDTDAGSNTLINWPVLSSARTVGANVLVQVALSPAPVGQFQVHYYANTACDPTGNGEGQTPIGVSSGTGNGSNANLEVSFPTSLVPAGSFITATMTDSGGNTSEFSPCEQVDATAGTANLGITKQDSPDPVTVGSPLTYTIAVTNAGPDASSAATVTDVLPATVTLVSASSSAGSCTGTTTVTCQLGSIASGSQVTVGIVVTPTAVGPLSNTATVTASGTDPDTANNSSTSTTTVAAAGPVNLVVTNTNDSGAGSLRQAILDANARIGVADVITFAIPGSGVRSIVASALPTITDPVTIDGTTQAGYAGTPIIELNGSEAGTANGLVVITSDSLIRGLIINRFASGNGIVLQGGNNNRVEGNWIGINSTGTAAAGNGNGVLVNSSGNTIGGTTAATRNVLSGNVISGVQIGSPAARGNVVIGNYIGTDPAGLVDLGNVQAGVIVIGEANVIGGTTPEARNIISGNNQTGVRLGAGASANSVEGNYIGTNVTGSTALANGVGVSIGVNVDSTASSNRIGGVTAAAANVIAFNTTAGVVVPAGSTNNAILGNAISNNGTVGIDLNGNGVTGNDAGDADSGGNDLQNFPVLTAAAGGVQGTLNSTPNGTFRIEFFGNTACDASGNGEGATFLGATTVSTDGAGNATIPLFTAAAGQFVTATATDSSNNTSEFSACVLTAATPEITVAATDAEAAELGPNTATFVVSRTGPTTVDLVVPITVGGTATLGTDYNLTSNEPLATAGGVEIRIPAGQASATITVNPVFNPAVEGLETITFTVGASVATVTIADEPAATITAPDANAVELGANTATVVVTRGGASTYSRNVQITVGGTATLGTDYLLTSNAPLATAGGVEIVIPAGQASATITVTPVADALTEGAETVVLTAEGSTTTVTIVDVAAPLSLTVTNTADSGAGSLRAAILAANANVGVTDTIGFDIPGPGPHSIALTSVLPVINDPVIIDGTTEPNFAGLPIVELVGTGIAGGNAYGLRLDAGGSTVRGLVINRFSLAGIQIVTGGANIITGNYIGTDTGGTLARANGTGIIVSGSVGNTIGGTSLAQRNVIAGNQSAGINIDGGSGNTVQGNYVGLTAAGTGALGNGAIGISVFASLSNVIGGTADGAGNVIAASTSMNLSLQGGSNNNTIQGNRIGTNAAGTARLTPAQNGVYLIGSTGNLIGGTVAAARNLISGGAGSGQVVLGVSSSSNTVQGNYIGTDVTGTTALTNSTWGIQIGGPGNTIGGSAPGAGNVISGNFAGGIVLFVNATGNTIHGNRIGTAADGVAPLGNQSYGIGIQGGAGNTIGLANAPNVIAFNTGAGISVTLGTQNAIFRNAISQNGGLGIDLGTTGVTANDAGDADQGPNNLQNFPVLTAAAGGVDGTLNSLPNATYRIEFFGNTACDASGNGEGATFLGAVDVTTDGTGNATIPPFTAAAGQFVTATATDSSSNTSEFSGCLLTTEAPVITLAATDPDAAELGGNVGTVVVTRTGPTTADRDVAVNISGTAFPGSDYDLTSPSPITFTAGNAFTIRIPAGQATATIIITPVFSAAIEGPESVILSAEGSTATVTIADEPPVTITATDPDAAEFGGNTGTVVVTRTGPTTYDRDIAVNISGTAFPGSDYDITSPSLITFTAGNAFTLRIPAGQTIATVTVTPIASPEVETAESVILSTEGGTATVTIVEQFGSLTFPVTTTADSGAGSLRQAILSANASPGSDLISFAIPGAGVHTITPASELPTITESVTIDGTTQTGWAGTPLIELNGATAGATSNGLVITGNSTTVQSLVINRFGTQGQPAAPGGSGIVLRGTGNHRVWMNYIGTDASGATALPNRGGGIVVDNSPSNLIGGTSPFANVVSGHLGSGIFVTGTGSVGTTISSNSIGTNRTGTSPLPNGTGILVVGASSTVIGGELGGNVISGNTFSGVVIQGAAAQSNVVSHNFIGANAGGLALGNGGHGVAVADGAHDTTIGGINTLSGPKGNVIRFNGLVGVHIDSGINNAILSNSISENQEIGIDLAPLGVTPNDGGDGDVGANNLQNFPVLTPATDGVEGTLNSAPSSSFRIEFFGNAACDASGNGEGATFLGAMTIVTDGTGIATIPIFTAAAGQFVTATATDSANNTSEFSNCIQVVAAPALTGIVPASGQQGATLNVTLAGENTSFAAGVTTVGFGANSGVTVNSVTVNSPISVTVNISIAPTTAIGGRTVTVTTGAQVVTIGFSVTAGPAALTGLTPASAQQGQSNVSIAVTGLNTHFVQGVTTASFGGAGVIVNLVTVNSPTSATVNISLEPFAQDARTVVLTTDGENAVSAANAFAILPGSPRLTVLSPASGQQGQTLNVAVTGLFTSFVNGTTTADFGAGIGVNSVTVTSATAATVNISISPLASITNRTVTLTTGAQSAPSLDAGSFFTVTPSNAAVAQVTPSTGQQAGSLSVTITGSNTHFANGSTVVSFGGDITVTSLLVTSPTSATANLSISPSATLGARAVTVTTAGEVATLANAFTVTVGTPSISIVSPSTGRQAETLAVSVSGQLTNFINGTTVANFGAGITVNSVTVGSATEATVNITIAPGAALGSRTVVLTTGAQVAQQVGGFTVTPGQPTLFSVSPVTAVQGTNTTVTLNGAFTNFTPGVTAAFFGSGISVGTVTVNGPSLASVPISIAAGAQIGPRSVTVTTGSESVTLLNGFTVQQGVPAVLSIDPNAGQRGLTRNVTVTGAFTNWQDGVTSVSYGPGITVNSNLVSSPTTLTTNITIDLAATLGPRDVVITTGTGVQTVLGGFVVNDTDVTVPTVLTISPPYGTVGVPLNPVITAEFNEPLERTTVNSSTFQLYDTLTGQPLSATVSLDATGRVARLVPSQLLAVSRQYYSYLHSIITDVAGNHFGAQVNYFTTGFSTDTAGPTLRLTNPRSGDTNIGRNARITLQFDRPLNAATRASGLRIQTSGVAVPGTYVLEDGQRRIRFTPATQLAASVDYTVTLTDELRDVAGNALTNPGSFVFTTGAANDTTAPVVTANTPVYNDSNVGLTPEIRVAFGEPVNPITVNSTSFIIYNPSVGSYIRATITLAADRRSAMLKPDAPLERSTQYYYYLSPFEDLAGNVASLGGTYFRTGLGSDTVAPALVSITPVNGATNVPVNARVRAAFSELIDGTSVSAATIQLTPPVAGTVTVSTDRLSLLFTPAANMAVSTTYTVQVAGVRDSSGNVMAPATSSFTTSASPTADTIAPTVVSFVPATGTTNVSVSSPIVLTVSEPIRLTDFSESMRVFANVSGFGFLQMPGSYSTNPAGTVITFTPSAAYPGATQLQVYSNYDGQIVDLAGNALQSTSATYTTAAATDTTAPTVVMVSPPDGATGIGPQAIVTLTFSEPLLPNTINADTFSLFAGNSELSTSVTRSADNQSIFLTANLPPETPITVVATGDITDLAGNALADFSSTFTTGSTFETSRPQILVQRPTGPGIPADASVTLFVSKPLDPATVPNAFYLSQNGVLVEGALSVPGDGTAIHFNPTGNLAPGALIQVFVTSAATDTFGNALFEYSGSFTVVADATTAAPTIVRSNPVFYTQANSTNAVVDVEFSEPLSPATVTSANFYVVNAASQPLAGTLSLRNGGRVVRFTGAAPFQADSYNYVYMTNGLRDLQNTPFVGTNFYFYTGSGADAAPPAIASVAPPAGATNVGISATVRVYFSETINPVSVTAGTLTLTSSAGVLPASFTFNSTNTIVTMAPQAPLPASTLLTLSINGIEDASGNVVAPQTTQFTTGTSADMVRPTVIGTNVTAYGVTNVPTNAVFQVTFDEPMDVGTVLSQTTTFLYDYGIGGYRSGTGSMSSDGLTYTFVPNGVLAVNRQHSINLGLGFDLAGNQQIGYSLFFTTTFAGDTTPPTVTAVNPAAGTAAVPRNARIEIRFSEAISALSLGNVRLLSNGTTPVAVTRTLSDGNYVLTLRPSGLLASNRSYTVSVAGVRDTSNNPIAATFTSTFSTGSQTDLVAPTITGTSPGSEDHGVGVNMVGRITFSEPVNPMLLNAGTFRIGNASGGPYLDAVVAIAANRRSATLTPTTPLLPFTRYYLQLASIADVAGNGGSGTTIYFYTGAGVDTTLPTVTAIAPANGAPALPVNTRITVVMSELIDATSVSNASIQLTPAAAGTVTLSTDRTTLTFVPSGNLSTSTAYSILVSGLRDTSSNTMAPASFGFTTGASTTPDTTAPAIVGRTPTNNSAGVGVTATLTITTSERITAAAVGPGSVPVFAVLPSVGTFQLAGQYSVDTTGTLITFSITGNFPANATIQWYTNYNSTIRDLAGLLLPNQLASFTTANVPDTAGPFVQSVTPTSGATDVGPYATVTLTLSESVNPNTVNANTIVLFAGTTRLSPSITRSTDNRMVFLSMALPLDQTITVIATTAITDMSGNALAPFSSTFRTAPEFDATRPQVITQRPLGSGVSPTTPITLFLNRAVNPATVPGALHVSQNGVLVTGTTSVSWSNQAITFTPTVPFAPQTTIEIVLTDDARDGAGNLAVPYHGTFATAGDPAANAPVLVRTNPPMYSSDNATNSVIELEFSEPINPATVTAANVFVRDSANQSVAGTLSQRNGNRVVRFTLAAPLAANSYAYIYYSNLHDLQGTSIAGSNFYFYTGAGADATNPSVTFVSPAAGSTGVGVNGSVRITFSELISPTTIWTDTVVLSAGSPLAATFTMAAGNRTIIVTPQLPLPPATLITVTINGVEDVAGHPVPVTTSSFTTGNAPDSTPPSLVGTSIFYGDPSVPVNSVFEWTYSEPIDAASVLTQQNVLYDYTVGAYTVGGTLSVSADARTVTYVPPANLVSGHPYSVNLGSVSDLAGNVGGSLSLFFTAAATSDVTAPHVLATNPGSGATGVPLNTRVRLAFDEPVSAASLQGINVLVSGLPLPVASRTLSNGERVVTISLTTLLAPNTVHTISASVKDRAGNAMGAPVTSTFTTGAGVDLVNPATTVTPSPAAGATGVPVGTAPSVTFSEAIDPTSVIYGGNSGVTLLVAATSQPVPIVYSFSADRRTVIMTPVSPLAAATQYRIQASATTTDLAGNVFPTTVQFLFTTQP